MNKFSKQIRIIIYILTALIVLGGIFSFNIFHLTSRVISNVYPEFVINNSDFNTIKLGIKDFKLDENGDFISETRDPWVSLDFEDLGIEMPRSSTVNISAATNVGERYEFFYEGSYKSEMYTMEIGKQTILLDSLNPDMDFGVRYDLTSDNLHSQTIHVSSFVFNDNDYLTSYYCQYIRLITLWILLIFISFVVANCLPLKKELFQGLEKNKFAICIMLFILGLCTILSGFWILAFLVFLVSIYLYKCLKDRIYSIIDILNAILSGFIGAIFICQTSNFPHFFIESLSDEIIITFLFVLIWNMLFGEIGITLCTVFAMILQGYAQFSLNEYLLSEFVFHNYISATLVINVLIFLLLYLSILLLLGKWLGTVVYYTLFVLLSFGTYVKVNYHFTLFSISDILIIKEFILILPQYISKKQLLMLIFIIFAYIVAIIKFRVKLKPKVSVKFLAPLLILSILISLIDGNSFSSIGIDFENPSYSSTHNINSYGIGVYTASNFLGLKVNGEPEDYGPSIVETIESYRDESVQNDIRPNVVLILAESLFEVTEIPDLSFDEDILSNLTPYKISNTISPSYGGGTADAEFESLTGLSNAFTHEESPYKTFSKPNTKACGLHRVFNENGYDTYSIHANIPSYYDRDKVYENMDVGAFFSKDDIIKSKKDFLLDGYVSDSPFFDKIIEVLNVPGNPKFILGISLEGHSPYLKKYKETSVKCTSDTYSDQALTEVQFYAQAMKNFDDNVSKLISYVNSIDTPTLVYIYGDHLPPLVINDEDGYKSDNLLQYSTPLYAFSNYKDISIDSKYISLSILPAEILRNSGVSYPAYYDFIYSLKKTNPIIQKNITEDFTTQDLSIYEMVTYDLLYGKKYLLDY